MGIAGYLIGFDTITSRVTGDQLAGAADFRFALTKTSLDAALGFFPTGSGWGTYELSPLSASGEPVGGTSMLTATAEARIPIFKRLRVALFVEAGNVWRDAWMLHLSELRYDAGPGVRFDTPFGLIRVDFGYQLRPVNGLRLDGEPQSSRWRMNFGIGEAF